MAELTYRDAVIRGIAQEMSARPRRSVPRRGHRQGRRRVQGDGRALRAVWSVARARHADFRAGDPRRRDGRGDDRPEADRGNHVLGFLAVCFDYIANEFPKSRYMSNGQTKCPLVVRTGNGAGSRFGAQHCQSVENWCMMIPGLKVVAPSSPRDVIGLLAAAVRDPDPVIFLEHKSLYATKGEVPDGEIVDTLGTAKICGAARTRPSARWR